MNALASALLFCALLPVSSGAGACAQVTLDPKLPHIDRSGVHPALIVDGAPYLMLGAQMNNSSSWAATMPAVWESMSKLGANTLEAPIYWESLEPTEGNFDFAQVDMLLKEACEHNTHLVLLWFGTWKNGSPGYTPEWIKRDQKRFPLAIKADGTHLFSLSPFGRQTLAADRNAFAALMQHLRQQDSQHTVIMVQVENETGMYGGVRDHSAAANEAFAEAVPLAVLRAMNKTGAHGNWSEVFREDAEEFFYAWAIARYVEEVAEAGKTAYPLPLYANAALRDPLNPGKPGTFESGAPTFDVLALWHAVAPTLDGLEPDIYMPEPAKFAAVLTQYSAPPWNAFFVPESGNSSIYAHYFFSVLGHGGFGWSPFGMDVTGYSNYPLGAQQVDSKLLAPYILDYRIAAPMQRELAAWLREDRVRGTAEGTAHSEEVDLPAVNGRASNWVAHVAYGLPSFFSNQPPPGNAKLGGEALIVSLGPDEFLVSGVQCRVDFVPVQSAGGKLQRMWISVDEGSYVNGHWNGNRLWNGDQTDYGLNFTRFPQVLRVRLMPF